MIWDTSTFIAVIALTVSVFSPILTAIVNNGHQRRMARIEFNVKHRAAVIEHFISSTGQVIHSRESANHTAYGASIGEVYMYTSKDQAGMLDRIRNHIQQHDWELAEEELICFCKSFDGQIVRPKI